MRMVRRILLIEDHPLFQQGFAAMLGQMRPEWRLELARDAREALERLDDLGDLDLIVIDINLPDMDGFAAARALAARAPQTPRVMISAREDLTALSRARDCGAAGLISKALPAAEILERLESVLHGDTAFETSRRGGDGSAALITERQSAVLALLAEGVSNKVIERRLNIAPRTVRAHLTDLFRLLDCDNRTQAIVEARRRGLIG